MWPRRKTPDARAATAARRATSMATGDLHEWAEQCTAALNDRVLGLRRSEAILKGDGHDAEEICAILGAVLRELNARYV